MRSYLLWVFMACNLYAKAQITTPVIKARFGIDADLRANYFNGLVQTANDDWFNLIATDTSGKYVIDTTGAAGIIAGYASDISPWPRRMATLFRKMNRPVFSIVNNRLWMEALWVRDYHGNDSTVFAAGSNKNGMSPADWSGAIQNIPDKNDILDVFMHIRRAGPNNTDSLWMFGGMSLDNTTGDRYFDFEMYQSDIYYDKASFKWYGYGPDAGHTRWQFDAAGNVTKPGDVIFSAQYQSSVLTNIEARLWVDSTTWRTVTPAEFNWSGSFDGATASPAYGYASILPKVSGAFYTGLGSANNVWAGPFQLVLQNNSITPIYIKDQFMEFSVNLSKLGLDPATQIGGDICGAPFHRLVIKTRASASFTAELKDFVAPLDMSLAPGVRIATDNPYICLTQNIARIYVTNPVSTSLYQWSTTNGHILTSPPVGTFIDVDTPGVYIVKQYLQAGCSLYASDTIQIFPILNCGALQNNLFGLTASFLNPSVIKLDWKVLNNQVVDHFEVERSGDGIYFNSVGIVMATGTYQVPTDYFFIDTLPATQPQYYRIKLLENDGLTRYSAVIRVSAKTEDITSVVLFPNPTSDVIQVQVNATVDNNIVQISIYDFTGNRIMYQKRIVNKGSNLIQLDDLANWAGGVYYAIIWVGDQVFRQKIMVRH